PPVFCALYIRKAGEGLHFFPQRPGGPDKFSPAGLAQAAGVGAIALRSLAAAATVVVTDLAGEATYLFTVAANVAAGAAGAAAAIAVRRQDGRTGRRALGPGRLRGRRRQRRGGGLPGPRRQAGG